MDKKKVIDNNDKNTGDQRGDKSCFKSRKKKFLKSQVNILIQMHSMN